MTSKTSDRKNGQLVLPGERLGVIEEFIPNAWTYVKNGEIFASVTGRALIDFLNKHVSVYPVGKPPLGEYLFYVQSFEDPKLNVKTISLDIDHDKCDSYLKKVGCKDPFKVINDLESLDSKFFDSAIVYSKVISLLFPRNI